MLHFTKSILNSIFRKYKLLQIQLFALFVASFNFLKEHKFNHDLLDFFFRFFSCRSIKSTTHYFFGSANFSTQVFRTQAITSLHVDLLFSSLAYNPIFEFSFSFTLYIGKLLSNHLPSHTLTLPCLKYLKVKIPV